MRLMLFLFWHLSLLAANMLFQNQWSCLKDLFKSLGRETVEVVQYVYALKIPENPGNSSHGMMSPFMG